MPEAVQAAPWVFYGSLALIVLIPFMFRTTAVFVVNLIGFIYPTFASAVAIYKNDDPLVGQWLIYWIIYAIFLIFQRAFGIVLNKIPFFPLFNALFLIALMHYPIGEHSTLAKYLYWKFLAKYFGKAASNANDALVEAADEMKNDPQGFADQLMNGNENKKLTTEDDTRNENFLERGSTSTSATLQSALDSAAAAAAAAQVPSDVVKRLGSIAESARQEPEKELEPAETSEIMEEPSSSANQRESGSDAEISADPRSSDTVTDSNNNSNAKAKKTTNDKQPHVPSFEQMARLDVDAYRRRAGDHNADKLGSSQEVLHLSQSEEDVDVDVDDKKDI